MLPQLVAVASSSPPLSASCMPISCPLRAFSPDAQTTLTYPFPPPLPPPLHPTVPSNRQLLFLAFNDTPHIHLTIIISVLSNRCMSSLFIAHVSLPYINTFCTHTL